VGSATTFIVVVAVFIAVAVFVFMFRSPLRPLFLSASQDYLAVLLGGVLSAERHQTF